MTIKELIEKLQHYDEDKEVEILEENKGDYKEYYLDFIYQTEENVCIEII